MTLMHRREIPHPVLTPWTDDYAPTSRFDAQVESIRRSDQAGRITIALTYHLTSPALQEMVSAGTAEYVTLTDASRSRARQAHRTTQDRHTISISLEDYQETVSIIPHIIASRTIDNLLPPEWSPFIREALPKGISIPQGAILALANPSNFSQAQAEATESIVEIVATDSITPKDTATFKLDISGDRISILVNPATKAAIDRLRKEPRTMALLFPSIYLAAIQEAVRKHTQEETASLRWAQVIARKLEDHGLQAQDPQELDQHALEWAQTLLEYPLAHLTGQDARKEEENLA